MRYSVCFIILFIFYSSYAQSQLPDLAFDYKSASVKTDGDKLIVSTGKVERIWKLTNAGLVTNSFMDQISGENYNNLASQVKADWSYYGLVDDTTNAHLLHLSAKQSNDEGFTSDHIEIVAEFIYPSVETSIKYIIWAYPDSEGIRTQLFIKGKAEKYIKNKELSQREDILFELVDGKNRNNYAAGEFAERYITTTAQDKNSVQYHAMGLDPKKNYKLGFTWWDFEGNRTNQTVRITSIDGEINQKVVAEAQLPDYRNNKDMFTTVLVDLPSETLLDGTCRIFFDKNKGDVAQVAEIFIYEEGKKDIQIANGIIERIDELKKNSPQNYSLMGYVDCGENIQGEKLIATGRVDYVPLDVLGTTRTYIGYYNNTQHRNKYDTPILKESVLNTPIDSEESVNWSNIVKVEKGYKGVILVKESHKCVNQYGVDTGEFIVSEKGVENTGTSLFPSEIDPNEYKWCWASWSIAYSGGKEGSQLALKEFDRLRYPVDPSRDIYLQANTWGSGRNKEASKEANILVELVSQADLGIDIQQIDDGWQTENWKLREDWYPDGWKNVVAKSKETGVKLGLWAAAMPVTYEALKSHYDDAGFITYKLDFASLGKHENMDRLIGKIRKFIKYTDHKVRVNWDLTENAPRFGYFWAKEYGCIYLENRKPDKPTNVVYIPALVLRDIWHVSQYTNINKFQTSIQNVAMTNKEVSDAYLYNDPYAVAIGLVGTPLFFQETHNYTQESRKQIKPLLATYKEHRKAMYDSYVFSIGNEPNNESWSGFQWYDPDKKLGYLMLYRELNNKEKEKELSLYFLKNKKVTLTNLETGTSVTETVGENGHLSFKINEPAKYKFIKYTYQ